MEEINNIFPVQIQDILQKIPSPLSGWQISTVGWVMDLFLDSPRAVAKTLIGGVHIHVFMFCSTSFFSNQIQISQFEKKSVGQNMNI